MVAVVCGVACNRQGAGPPYAPAQSLAMMQVEEGYRVEPWASEPDIVSPVAMEVDEDGRIYVVEDRGYPLNVKGLVGRVKLLEDTNGDGIPDRSRIFADGLVLPTGVMRWKKGILVTDAPDVWYLEDSDGDGTADVRTKVLTGFPFTNPQHTVNGPVYGLDNSIYLAHENATTAIIFKDEFGDRGSDIRFAARPEVALEERGRSVRFHPDRLEIEALSAPSQFGHAFDDFGRRFVHNNTYHARHEAVEARYLRRNPNSPVTTAVEEISDHGRPAKVYPIVPKTRFELLTNVGEFTSACGLTFWRGGAYVAEPAHNLVHRDTYSPAGTTFRASRGKEGSEFLASRDPWFRPVNFYVGPDHSMYMLDYYRLVVEHPEWMATETYHSKDLTAGIDRGRIYRITPAQGWKAQPLPRLGAASTAQLVEALANENPWWRRTAQRLLVDRKPPDAVPLLETMAASHASPVARVHALWTLDGLGRLETARVEAALRDASPDVRENAIRLAERRLSNNPRLTTALLSMAGDSGTRVRFQLLCTLGSVPGSEARAVRDKLLAAGFNDHWTQVAALSAGPEEASRLFALAVRRAAPASFFRKAATVVGSRRDPSEIGKLLDSLKGSGEWRAAALEGLAAGLRGKASAFAPALESQVIALFEGRDPAVRQAALRVMESTGLSDGTRAQAALRRAAGVAADRFASEAARADAIGLLALSTPVDRRALLESLIAPSEPETVQSAAVRALGRVPGEETGRFLLKNWRAFPGDVRLDAADAMFRDPARIPMVVAALKSGDIQPWTLAFRHRRQLIMHRDAAIRDDARPLLEGESGERAKVIAQYQQALNASADRARGKQVFDRVCAKCHKLDGAGSEVGPDLATVRHQPKQTLLAAILNPSESISQGFEAYVVEASNGTLFDGVLGPQTATTVTLRHEEGREDVIQRKDIKSMYVTNLSAMPGDLEKQVNASEMADLLEYLKNGAGQ